MGSNPTRPTYHFFYARNSKVYMQVMHAMKRKAASHQSFADNAAGKRIDTLLSLSQAAYFEGEQELSNRYVTLARKIAMRHRLKIGVEAFCKHCNQIFCEQGKTHKVRVISGKAYRVCGFCGKRRMTGKARKAEGA